MKQKTLPQYEGKKNILIIGDSDFSEEFVNDVEDSFTEDDLFQEIDRHISHFTLTVCEKIEKGTKDDHVALSISTVYLDLYKSEDDGGYLTVYGWKEA